MERSVDFQPVHRGIRSHYRLRAVLYYTAFFDIIGAIALWMLIKVKDEELQVQLATS